MNNKQQNIQVAAYSLESIIWLIKIFGIA